jgi:hypothetical protein
MDSDKSINEIMVCPEGIEPPTLSLEGRLETSCNPHGIRIPRRSRAFLGHSWDNGKPKTFRKVNYGKFRKTW